MNLNVWPEKIRERYHAEGWWDDRTVSSEVARRAIHLPDGLAFVDESGSVTTWQDYDRVASLVAGALVGAGTERGGAAAVMLPDAAILHEVWVGASRSGQVVIAIPHRSGHVDIARLVDSGACSILITESILHDGRRAADMVAQLRTANGWSGTHITVDSSDADVIIQIADAPAPIADVPGSLALSADELFLINFTSGTTGRPKGVMQTQNRWKFQTDKCVHLGDDETFVVVVPATGGMGLWFSHIASAMLGATTVLMRHFTPEATFAAVQRHQATVLACVPTQMKMLLAHPQMDTADLSSLRILELGGEALPFEKAREFERRTNARCVQIYGSTESGIVSGPTRLDDDEQHRLGTAGRSLQEMEVRLLNEHGDDLAIPGRGQCAVRGPAASAGYYNDPDANGILYREDGWLLLGDIVELDGDGYLRVVGRVSDFIIRGGLNISAVEVEEAVGQHPRVSMAAAVSMPDEILGERVCVYVTTRSGEPLEMPELTSFLQAEGVSKSKWPERIINIDAIPVAAGGKIAKGQLRDDIRARIIAEHDMVRSRPARDRPVDAHNGHRHRVQLPERRA